jgi:hypothetical protein
MEEGGPSRSHRDARNRQRSKRRADDEEGSAMKDRDYKDEEAEMDAGKKSWRDGLITAAELQTKQFKPVHIILPSLIPEGVTILAGKPKIGKSWLALDVCLAVADETRFVLGEMKPVHGDALYLALEDSQRRLKKRLSHIIQEGQNAWSPRLQLHTEWKRFDQGGLEDIEEWITSVTDPRLIWIDTLVKVRPQARKNEAAYDGDYRAMAGLQTLAGKYPGLGIVVCHHLRKASSEDDAFDDVNGTLGLTGAADTIIVMKRHSGMVKVFVRGRDIEDGEFAAEFNRNTYRWRLVGNAAEVFRSKERQGILAALREAARSMSVSEIMAATERRDRKATDMLLYKMEKDGEVVHAKRGRWRHPDTPPDDDPISTVGIVGKVVKQGQPIDNLREKRSKNTNANTNASALVGIHTNANTNASETVGIAVGISEQHKRLKNKNNSAHYHDPNDTNGTEHSGRPKAARPTARSRGVTKRNRGSKAANGPAKRPTDQEFAERYAEHFERSADTDETDAALRSWLAEAYPPDQVEPAFERVMKVTLGP